MSATDFYLNKGYTPTWKTAVISAAGTVTIWTPRSSTRIVLTELHCATNLATSAAFYFGNLAGLKILQMNLAASGYVDTEIHADSNTMDRTLVGNVAAGSTDGFKVTAVGFEIET